MRKLNCPCRSNLQMACHDYFVNLVSTNTDIWLESLKWNWFKRTSWLHHSKVWALLVRPSRLSWIRTTSWSSPGLSSTSSTPSVRSSYGETVATSGTISSVTIQFIRRIVRLPMVSSAHPMAHLSIRQRESHLLNNSGSKIIICLRFLYFLFFISSRIPLKFLKSFFKIL